MIGPEAVVPPIAQMALPQATAKWYARDENTGSRGNRLAPVDPIPGRPNIVGDAGPGLATDHPKGGVVQNPTFTDADRIFKEVADEMGFGDTGVPTQALGSVVIFGPDGTKAPGTTCPIPFSVAQARSARAAWMRLLHDGLRLVPEIPA